MWSYFTDHHHEFISCGAAGKAAPVIQGSITVKPVLPVITPKPVGK